MSEKQKFLNYCYIYRDSLERLQKSIEQGEFVNDKMGTLVDIGINYSYKLANIGFKFGLYNHTFKCVGDLEDIRENLFEIILKNRLTY